MCDEMKIEMIGDSKNCRPNQKIKQEKMTYCNSSQSSPSVCQDKAVQYCDPSYKTCKSMCFRPRSPPRMQLKKCEEICNPFLKPPQNPQDCKPCIDLCKNRPKTPCTRRCYVQPPRRPSFKPTIYYKPPEIPMSDDTIYRRSFEGVDAHTAACCRAPAVRPNGMLRIPCGKFDGETITQLSFPQYCRVDKRKPLIPFSRPMLGTGPMQALTTQKHDFVPKFQYRRVGFYPHDNLTLMNGCFEKETVQSLSFMPPCVVSRAQSCRPISTYKRPELPMESETIHKLSFTPVCPAPKEELPWAQKGKYKAPTIPFAEDTVTKLSYQPPGCFIDVNECCYDPCDDEEEMQVHCDAPRAAC